MDFEKPSLQGYGEKKQEIIQAQAEIFADKGIKDFSDDQAKILEYSAELSKIKDLNNLPLDLPEELVILIRKHKDSYVDFLRQERKLETSFIEENIRTYKEKFQAAIISLKSKIEQGNPKEIPEFLGAGSNGWTFLIEVDGINYAAKFSRRGGNAQANFEIKPLIRAKGIPHTSQLVSYSNEDGVVIMELIKGRDMTQFDPEKRPQFTDEDIMQLIDTVIALDERGLVIDPKPSNFVFDEKAGFSVLDYQLKNSESRYKLPQEIMDLRTCLTWVKREYDLDFNDPNYEDKSRARSIEWHKMYLPIMVRFLKILKEKYPDILSAWSKQHEEDRNNPRMYVSEIIDRESIPDDQALEPYLKKLEALGF